MLLKHSTLNTRRSGIILLVVMAMLALFATVALSFVFYAEAEATASRFAAQANVPAKADADPELLLSYFLSQLIYDTDNPYSAKAMVNRMWAHFFGRGFFNPIDDGHTQLVVSTWSKLASWRAIGFPLLKRILAPLVRNEILLDKAMLEKIADKSPDLDGMKLSRFDKPLAEARKRIAAIYLQGSVASRSASPTRL